MKPVAVFLLAAALAALALAGAIVYLAYRVPVMLEKEIRATRGDLREQIQETRQMTLEEIARTRTAVLALTDKHLGQIEADLNFKLDQTEIDLNARLNDTNAVLNHALAEYDKTAVGTVSAAFDRIDLVAFNVAGLADKLNTQEPMIYSRYLATTGELNKTLDVGRRVSEEIAKAAPALTDSAVATSNNVALISGDVRVYTRPKGFVKGTLLPLAISAARLIF